MAQELIENSIRFNIKFLGIHWHDISTNVCNFNYEIFWAQILWCLRSETDTWVYRVFYRKLKSQMQNSARQGNVQLKKFFDNIVSMAE